MKLDVAKQEENSCIPLYSRQPGHWQIKRLKWSTNGIYNGIWGDEPNGEDDIICVRVADFDRNVNRVIDEPPTIRAVEARFLENRKLEPGDLLIEKSGGGDNQLVGCVVSFNHQFDATCSNFVARLKSAPDIHSHFFVYLHAALYAAKFNFPAIKQTTGIQNLDADAYFDIKVAFPPQKEQHLIAEYLDRETAYIDALIAEKERMLALLEEKRAALISQAVTHGLDPDVPLKPSGLDWLGDIPAHWETPPVYARFEVQLGKMLDEKKIKRTHLAPYLRNVDVQWGVINTSNLPEMDFDDADRIRLALKKGDVLVCEGGEIGRAAIWKATLDECYYQKALHRLRPLAGKDNDNPDFFVYVMRTLVQMRVFSSQANSATIQHLPAEKLRIVRFPAPPYDEQHSIVEYLDKETTQIDAIREAIADSIALIKERRSALITAAVTGQIDPREMAA